MVDGYVNWGAQCKWETPRAWAMALIMPSYLCRGKYSNSYSLKGMNTIEKQRTAVSDFLLNTARPSCWKPVSHRK